MKTLKEALQHRGVLGKVSSADWIRVVGSSLGEHSGVLRSSPRHVVLWAQTSAVAAELGCHSTRLRPQHNVTWG